jgi:hypothetical protein
MGRSRSRSSSSSSSSDSEDSEEREEREAREQRRKDERRERRKAEREAAEKKRKEDAAELAAGKVSWNIIDTINNYEKDEDGDDDDDDESQNIVTLLGRKAAGTAAEVVDCATWSELEAYLRAYFEVHRSNKKVGLRLKFLVGAETKLSGRVSDAATMANWWAKLAEMLLVDAASSEPSLPTVRCISAELFALQKAVSIKRKKKPESEAAKAQRELFRSLVTAVYGEHPGHFAGGQWTEAASEIARRNPKMMEKFLTMQRSRKR